MHLFIAVNVNVVQTDTPGIWNEVNIHLSKYVTHHSLSKLFGFLFCQSSDSNAFAFDRYLFVCSRKSVHRRLCYISYYNYILYCCFTYIYTRLNNNIYDISLSVLKILLIHKINNIDNILVVRIGSTQNSNSKCSFNVSPLIIHKKIIISNIFFWI